jgi:hypothetical protein
MDVCQKRKGKFRCDVPRDDDGTARWLCVVGKVLVLEKIETEWLTRCLVHLFPVVANFRLGFVR